MYDAAPPRPRATGILRSRGGCRPCKGIRRKCDERKPGCLRCEKSGRQCCYRDGLKWRDSNAWAAYKVKQARGDAASQAVAPLDPGGGTFSTLTLRQDAGDQAGDLPASDCDVRVSFEYENDSSSPCRPQNLGPSTAASAVCPWVLSEDSYQTTPNSSPSSSSFQLDCNWTPIYTALLPSQPSQLERRYLAHFSSHVLGILPKNLEPMHPFIHGTEMLLYAAMATSAANLSRMHGKYVPSGSKKASALSWAPEANHKINAFHYAGRALSLATRDCKTDPVVFISAQVLLSLVERELGTFEGLRRYLGSVQSFVSQTREELLGSQSSRELVKAVMDYHSLQSILSATPWDTRVSSAWLELGNPAASESPSIFQVLGWEAFTLGARLSLLEAMRHSRTHSNPLRDQQITQVASIFAPQAFRRPPQELALEHIAQELEQTRLEIKRLSKTFRQCHPSAELLGFTGSSSHGDGADHPTLRFASHEDAMNTADFVFCRIMCDEALLGSLSLPTGSPEMPDISHIHTWVAILLQIATGVDMSASAIRNVYRPGITQMAMACVYSCRDAALLDFLEAFYERAPVEGYGYEQVGFPSSAAVPALGIIRSQLELGRTILIMQPLGGHLNLRSAINRVEEWTSCSVHGLEANGDFFDEVFQDLRHEDGPIAT